MRPEVDLHADRVCPKLCERHAGRLQLMTPRRLKIAGKELFAEAQATSEIEDYRQIGPRVRQRRNHRFAQLGPAAAAGAQPLGPKLVLSASDSHGVEAGKSTSAKDEVGLANEPSVPGLR
jgi:hypothetical protein